VTAFRFRWTRECVLFGNVGGVAQTAAQKKGEYGCHLAAARWDKNTLRSFCAQRFEGTFSRPGRGSPKTLVPLNDHRVVLTLQPKQFFMGSFTRKEWLRSGVPVIKIRHTRM
jgi:hypothetical protein